jgi:hypothetical protein
MTEYWIVKPDEIKNLDADTMSPLEFSNFRHGEYFEKHQGAYYYSTDKMAHVSLRMRPRSYQPLLFTTL